MAFSSLYTMSPHLEKGRIESLQRDETGIKEPGFFSSPRIVTKTLYSSSSQFVPRAYGLLQGMPMSKSASLLLSLCHWKQDSFLHFLSEAFHSIQHDDALFIFFIFFYIWHIAFSSSSLFYIWERERENTSLLLLYYFSYLEERQMISIFTETLTFSLFNYRWAKRR